MAEHWFRGVVRVLCLVLLLGAGLGFAQGRAPAKERVGAQLSTGVCRLGERVVLTIVAEDAEQGEIANLPKVDGLLFGPLTGPSRMSGSVVTGNGRATRYKRCSWSVEISPERLGEYELPPITVRLADGEFQTASLHLSAVEDLRGEELGYLEVQLPSERVVAGEPFVFELLFGWDLAVDERINSADLSLPWWGNLPGVLEKELAPSKLGSKQVQLSLNTRATVMVEELEHKEIRGRSFRLFRLRRSMLPTEAGILRFTTSFLEFSRVAGGGLAGGRKVESFFVRQTPIDLRVEALPEAGRPPEFSGAIGELSARARLDTRDVTAGDSLKLTVDWRGTGNLEYFEAPDLALLDGFSGFKIYGRVEVDRSIDGRTVTYDIAPLSERVHEVPPVPLWVFNSRTWAYEQVQTAAIPVRVRPLAGSSPLLDETATEQYAEDLHDVVEQELEARPSSELRGPARLWDWAAAGSVLLVSGLGLRQALRRRADPAAPLERRRRRALRALRRRARSAVDARERLDALHEYLGARTREPALLWQGRDARAWNREHQRLAPELEARLAAQLRELEASAWSGQTSATLEVDGRALLELASALQQGGL